MECNKLPEPQGLLKDMYDNILENSYVAQPSFALSASLTALSTLVGRKMQFQGIAPNLYVLNVAPSGSGKDMPQKKIKEFFVDANCTNYIGTGSYTSDAGITDRMQINNSLLDIVDEAGEELLKINNNKTEYGGKMAAILAELYTSSTGTFLGRALKDGSVGQIDRPNLNILASTTPTGFAQGVSRASIEKGLLGRFFVFIGDYAQNARRIKQHTKLDKKSVQALSFWAKYKAPETDDIAGNVAREYLTIQATDEANAALDKVFAEYDNMRLSSTSDNILLPVIARLYQQTLKIALLHAVSRNYTDIPVVDYDDVLFAYHLVNFAYKNYAQLLESNFSENKQEKIVKKVLEIIRNKQKIYFSDLVKETKGLHFNQRSDIIKTLEQAKLILIDVDRSVNEQVIYYKGDK